MEADEVVLPVVRPCPRTGVDIREDTDIDVLNGLDANVRDLEIHGDKVVDAVGCPLVALLSHEEMERIVVGPDVGDIRLVVRVPTAEHLVGYRRVILVDLTVAVIVAAVEPVFIDLAVMVVVRVGVREPVPTRRSLVRPVHDVDGIVSRSELGLVLRSRDSRDPVL